MNASESIRAERDELLRRYPVMECISDRLTEAADILVASFASGGKLLVCGNGGSSADSDHIAGELMKSFMLKRPLPPELHQRLSAADPEWGPRLAGSLQRGLPAIALTRHTAMMTAWANDEDEVLVYAQQVAGYGRPGDVFLGISTSGNAKNVLAAAVTAKAMGLYVIGLTGEGGGKLAAYCDVCLEAPGKIVYHVQELHLPIYHFLCLAAERSLA